MKFIIRFKHAKAKHPPKQKRTNEQSNRRWINACINQNIVFCWFMVKSDGPSNLWVWMFMALKSLLKQTESETQNMPPSTPWTKPLRIFATVATRRAQETPGEPRRARESPRDHKRAHEKKSPGEPMRVQESTEAPSPGDPRIIQERP